MYLMVDGRAAYVVSQAEVHVAYLMFAAFVVVGLFQIFYAISLARYNRSRGDSLFFPVFFVLLGVATVSLSGLMLFWVAMNEQAAVSIVKSLGVG